jgi:Xaa-Pro aminopeptidase
MSSRAWTPCTPSDALVVRRTKLANALGERRALLVAGRPRARNYPANRYPFRAESHFLYFVGQPIAGAALLLDGSRSTLFVEPGAPDDPLWHGEVPGPDAVRERTGVDEVLPLDRLPSALGSSAATVATIPSNDDGTAAWQSTTLGRAIAPRSAAALGEIDAPLADAIISLRLSHDAAAIAQLRSAAEVTLRGHLAGMRALRPGIREAEVCAAIEAEFAASGMTTAYGSIVTTRGEILHNESHHRVIEKGDLLLVDAGAETAEGWACDVTRVWPASGKLTSTQRALYELVLASNRAATRMVRSGTRYRDIHFAAGRVIVQGLRDLGVFSGEVDGLCERGAAALFFPHGVGHLMGLDVHDMEDLGDRAGYAPGRTRSTRFGDAYLRLDRDLVPGMAVTIEPGFYRVPAILDDPRLTSAIGRDLDRDVLARYADVRGIRLENDVLCTTGDPEVLTAAIPIEAEEVERIVGA